MKKMMTIIMASFMTLGLTACGGAGADADLYLATNVKMMGITMSPEEISESGITLALDDNGKATLTVDGEDYNCKWTTEGDVFTLSQGSDEFEGTKEGDVVTIINMLDSGMDINFLKEGATPPVDKSKPTEEASVDDNLLNVVIEPMEKNDEIDNQLVEVIKVIREYTDIPLRDAKDLVEEGGFVKSASTPEEAEEMKVRLEELGIVVDLE